MPNGLFRRSSSSTSSMPGSTPRGSRSWSRPGCTGRTRPELAELIGSRWSDTVEDREPLRATTRRMTTSAPRGPRRAGQARPPLRRGRPQDRHQADRARTSMAGYSGAQGDRPWRRTRTRSPPSTAPGSLEHPRATLRPRRQSAARGPARGGRDAGGALALNTVIDEERRLSFVSFGEIVESHLDAVRFMSEYAEVRLPSGSARWSPAPPAIRWTRPTIRP